MYTRRVNRKVPNFPMKLYEAFARELSHFPSSVCPPPSYSYLPLHNAMVLVVGIGENARPGNGMTWFRRCRRSI